MSTNSTARPILIHHCLSPNSVPCRYHNADPWCCYIYIYIHFFGRTQIQPSAEELRAVVQAIRRGPFCVSELFPLRSRYWAHLSLRRVLPFFLHTHAMSWSNQTGHVLRARERERGEEREGESKVWACRVRTKIHIEMLSLNEMFQPL